MRIAVDAMGGDHAPREIVRGVAAGLKFIGESDELILYGVPELVEAECQEAGLRDARVRIEPCSQVVGMDDPPVEALRHKRDSSIARMAADAGKHIVDAIISAGNTGAFVAACQLRIKPIEGVSRPGIAVLMPTFHGPVILCDVGANVAPKPHHLHEYARMCAIYATQILKIKQPKVGLISIGEEDAKGNPLVKQARARMKEDRELRFIGNQEGRDIFAGTADVYISDGFTGNVILKLTEGLAEGLFKTIRKELEQESRDLATHFEPVVERIWKKHDFAEHGGAPLLGVNSVVLICHGRSDARAIANAVRASGELVKMNLNAKIAEQLTALASEEHAG